MTPREWASPYGVSVYVGLGLALVVLLLLARRLARSPSARRWPLLVLRAAVLATLVFILLNLVTVTEARAPEIVYLVDCSRSMALDRPAARLDLVKQAIARSDRLITTSPPPQVRIYRFGEGLAATTDLSELSPSDDATGLLHALDRLPSHFADRMPVGVVIFSDGRTSETAGFEEIAAGYRRPGVPLHVYPVGDSVTGDVAIENLVASREVAAGTTVPVRVVVRSRGYAGQRAEVRLRLQTEPSPEPARLEELARGSGGTILHSAEQLVGILNTYKTSLGEVVVYKTSLWDHPALWLLLLALLTADWLLRRWWGLA